MRLYTIGLLYITGLALVLLSGPFAARAAEGPLICPMHPHISGEAGDTCPICGMALVPRNKEGAPALSDTSDGKGVNISPQYRQALGVRDAEAAHHRFGRTIKAFARIVPSTRDAYVMAVRKDGWIVDLAKDAVGDRVEKGDLLFTLYSPDLITAQSDYLLRERGTKTFGDPRTRLRIFGMADKAVKELEEKGELLYETPFYAPAEGVVAELHALEGDFVGDRQPVMTVQDYGTLWLQADVPVRDAGFLQEGTPATIYVKETGKTIESRIDFIHPVADEASRTVRVRLVLDNEGGDLRPGLYADVSFHAEIRRRLAVPAGAVLHGEDGAYVIRALGAGRFAPQRVETGMTANGHTEILDGLEPGDRVVATGQFMLDAATDLSAGMARMHGDGDHQAASGHEGGAHVH